MSGTIKQAIDLLKLRIANAYAAVANKGGTLPATQDTANLPSAIASIPAFNRAMEISRGSELKDYTIFMDFDGTLLYAFTKAEILSMTELPENYKTHDGLTFVHWNIPLETLKNEVTEYGWRDVGAIYTPTDGWGQIEIKIDGQLPNYTPHFRMVCSSIGELYINWGDGVVETYTSNTDFDVRHTYTEKGHYLVKFRTETDFIGIYVYNDSKSLVVGRFVFPSNATNVGRVLGGNNPVENATDYDNPQCLSYTMVETIVLPPGCNYASNNNGSGIGNMYKLKSLVSDVNGTLWRASDKTFPSIRFFSLPARTGQYSGFYDINELFINARSQFWGTVSDGAYHLGVTSRTFVNLERFASNSAFSGNESAAFPRLKTLPALSPVGGYWITNGLRDLYSADTYPEPYNHQGDVYFANLSNNILIKDYNQIFKTGSGSRFGLFTRNTSLQTVSLRNGARTIQANAFLDCFSLREIHILDNGTDSVITLANVNAFTNCPSDMKIFVPARLVDAYKTATNWSTYADQIYADPNQE